MEIYEVIHNYQATDHESWWYDIEQERISLHATVKGAEDKIKHLLFVNKNEHNSQTFCEGAHGNINTIKPIYEINPIILEP